MTDNVGELLTQRGNQWGDAVGTHVRIAQVWSGILDHEVQPVQVALMMEGLKLVRASINPADLDSFHDAQGYSRIAELIAGHRTSLDDKQATEPSDFEKAAWDAVHLVVDSAEQEELPAPLLYGCDYCNGTPIPGATFCQNDCVKQREVNPS